MTRGELDRELRALAAHADWPPAPDVAAGIVTRLPARTVERPAHPRIWTGAGRSTLLRRPLAAAALATLVVLVAIGGAVEPVRAKIERLLGIAGGERVVRVEKVSPAARLDLGRAVSLAEARRLAGFRLLLPHDETAPGGVRLGGDLAGNAVSLLYGEDTVLTEFPGTQVYSAVKQIARGVRVRSFAIGTQQGIWIADGPRVLLLADDNGRVRRRAAALPGAGVLLWQSGDLALRLETRRGLAAALALARSVR